jgi:predicted RNase H-like HicB family nuclease
MENSKKLVYPSFIKQHEEGDFGVYFPTLFPEDGWEYPLAGGATRDEAIKNAQKELTFSLAGILYDNEDLPRSIPIQSEHLSEGMEIIDIETTISLYSEEIKEHLKGRHWHISYYLEDNEDEVIEAIGYKNDQGEWDIFFDDYSEEEETLFFDSSYKKNPHWPDEILLFSVHLRTEAQEKFNQFVEKVILKRRTSNEWLEREKNRLDYIRDSNNVVLFEFIDEKVKIGEMTESEAALIKQEMTTDLGD